MNDKLLPALARPLRLRTWELLCLLAACTLLGIAVSNHQIQEYGKAAPVLPAAALSFLFLLPPVAYQMQRSRRMAMAKPVGEPLNNNPPEPKKPQDEAVSPVIGVILMVAITVMLAAVVIVLVSNLTKHQISDIPEIALISQDNGSSYYVAHNTDKLSYPDLIITGCTAPTTGLIHAGDSWTTCTGTLTVVHKPSNTVLYRSG